ncbi:ABC transporter ATP-binding protein [Paenibacillus oleatilyticus]|uniref:ABC transporter ATP-binding protein n=1 Tax=Paenibacillus oleatilyticus TaxID=2594886 RepID=UPI001C1F8099|nr:ABC transporter ATP-binding protein [Paenibacillus oleatilyticus]MBU7317869.1 ABC transporter ATP-binding protein [Paenibacillus oleatilyticus]
MPNLPLEQKPLLDIRDLHVEWTPSGRKEAALPVLTGISLAVYPGEVVGIVGESGCGKSALSLSVVGLLPRAMRVAQGEIWYQSAPVHQLGQEETRRLRGKEIAMVFQDPMTSLNPALSVGEQLTEMLRLHLGLTRREAKARAADLLRNVGLPRPEALLSEYPHRFSGGMRQRVMIAMALSCRPQLLIADEPTTALDVTIQAQILELLKRISAEERTAIMLVSHDLGIIADMCDRIAVMYAGQIVEEGPVEDIFDAPRHPYTIGLLNSIPSPAKKKERLYSIPGTVPALHERGGSCRFYSRCPQASDRCLAELPGLTDLNGRHAVRCLLAVPGGGTSHAAG